MALLLMSATTPIESATRKQKQEFTKAMNSFNPSGRKLDAKSFVAELGGSSQRSRSLRNKVMKKATFVPPEDIRKHGGNPLLDNKKRHRSLEDQEQAQKNYWNQYKDGADDYFVAAGEWNNEFGFDPTQFAFSYARCAQVRQFDDELAATEDSLSVFATKHFAIFRFCPAMTCMGVNSEEDAEQQNQNGQQNNNGNSAYNTAYYGYTYNDVYGEGEEEVLVGANAEGCQSNYGEYMIELEDYLAIMQEYHEERFQAMCEYCDDCMEAVYKKWMQSQRRDLSNESEESLRESFRELGERELGIDYYGICPEWDVCSQDVCGGGMEDEYSDYFECTEVERNNGMVAYVGPHCAEDGMTVTLGVYADEYCNEYIGYGVNIRNYIGEDLDEDALQEYYNPIEEQCIPCRSSVRLFVAFSLGRRNHCQSKQPTLTCALLYFMLGLIFHRTNGMRKVVNTIKTAPMTQTGKTRKLARFVPLCTKAQPVAISTTEVFPRSTRTTTS